MKKRLLSLLLSLCVMLSLLPAQVFAAEQAPSQTAGETTKLPFADVPEKSWYAEDVRYAWENGLFSGTGATTFEPNGTMTRGMFVTVIGRMAGVDEAAYRGKSDFSDVPASAYYAPYVAWAAERKITSGTGGGNFSPNSLVSRQQMAVFLTRFYETLGYDLPPATVTTMPGDMERIAGYAREAALTLWACGLFVGDAEGNFCPAQMATRAQAAVLLTRIDRHLVSTDQKAPASASDGGDDSSGNGGEHTSTTYYEVQFALVDGQSGEGISLPETKLYASGTKITELPTPYQRNGVFLGWYYDAVGTAGTESGDTVCKNMTLYADFAAETVPLDERDTPCYLTKRDVSTDFTFHVQAESTGAVRSGLTIICVTDGNRTMDFEVSDGDPHTVSARLEPGQTYKAQLAEDSGAVFYEGEALPTSIRTLNFITRMEEVLNLGLADGLVYLPLVDVSNMTGTALDGLISLSVTGGTGEAQANMSSGSFSYAGDETITVGDTVVIYEGQRPDTRTAATDDAVAYVTVTKIDGQSYIYTAADSEDVLFTPDVLPVPTDADTDGNTENYSITVPFSTFAYTDAIFTQAGLDETSAPDEGDFLAFYSGTAGARDAGAPQYGEIISVETYSNESGEFYTIAYTPADESVVMDSMNIYSQREEDIALTPEQRSKVEADIERQAVESGFVDEAANYLMALADETDGFEKLSESAQVRLTAADDNGNPVPLSALSFSGKDWEWGGDDKKVEAHITKDLDHFDGNNGLRVELKLSFSAEKDLGGGNKIGIELEAVFEQEILLSINISGGAIWKKSWIFPYIYDYRLNANIDVGTFTGIAVTAVAKTSKSDEEEEGVDWDALGIDVKSGEKLVDIGEKIVDLMNEENSFLGQPVDGEDDEGGDESSGNLLVDKYAEMMGEADESWIELVHKKIFSIEGSVDPFHILVYGFGADFVVSSNLYITLGMTFEYGNAKRYNFSLLLFHQQASNETIDLEEAHYEFVFYVMGTIGIKAGIELEVGVGLFSLKLDSIGITAEVGAYAQLWGYFYYRLAWSQSQGKDSIYSGALYVEVGIYLEIKFKAQLFSSDKLTYNPTLYENKWPLWSAGQAGNVYDFAYPQEEAPEFVWYKVFTQSVPDDVFVMAYMDLTSGETDSKAFDDKRFTVTFTNPAFSYDAEKNLLSVDPGEGNVQEAGEMNLIWKGTPIAFTSRPISRTIPIVWTDPTGGYYIKFESNGGSNVNMLYKKEGSALALPKDPVKRGYVFAGWYADEALQTPYVLPAVMPKYDTTVYAKWDPATDTRYTVRHYLENLNDSRYTLTDTAEYRDGVTDSSTNVCASEYTGFYALPVAQQTVKPDGSTVVDIYYDRNLYTASFTYGSLAKGGDEDTAPMEYTKKYGSAVCPPRLALGGYDFAGYESWPVDADGKPVESIVLESDKTYAARWTARSDTPYRVEHYLQRVGGSGYLLDAENGVEYKTGTTGDKIDLNAILRSSTGFAYEKAAQDGVVTTAPVISADGKTVVKLYYMRNSHTVSWNADNGADSQSTEHLYGAAVYAPAPPTKQGYTFGGWYYDANVWEKPFEGGVEPMQDRDIALTARWIPGTATAYKVETYLQNIADDSFTLDEAKTQSLTGSTDEKVSASPESIAGFTFDEGNVENMLSGVIAADGSLVLKRYYIRNSYTATWLGYGGAVHKAETLRYGALIVPPDSSPAHPGYGFTGWEGLDGGMTMGTEPLTFTAQWGVGQAAYKVETYLQDIAGSSFTRDENKTQNLSATTDTTVTAAEAAISGFTFDKDNAENVLTGVVAADGSLVLKLYYTRNTYAVTWNDRDITTTTDVKFGASYAPPDPADRTGYTFGGWFTAETGGTQVTGNTALSTAENHTLYARWGLNEYTITYTLNGGTVSGNPFFYTVESESITLTNPIWENHTFMGWTGTNLTAATETVTIPMGSTGNRSYVATWKASTYTITYELDGGTNSPDNPAEGQIGETVTLTEPSKEGCTFSGWYRNADFTGEPATSLKQTTGDSVTLYAKWLQIYKITYVVGDGNTNTQNPSIYQMGDTPIELNAAEHQQPNDYAFAGWYWDEAYTDGPVESIPAGKTGDLTLYAKWLQGTLIKTQQELVAINGQSGSYVLANDLTVTSWHGITSFSGMLDGNGHTITFGEGSNGALITILRESGEVKNLTVSGMITCNTGTCGGLVIVSYGTVTDCAARNLTITANSGYSTRDADIGGLIAEMESGTLRFTRDCTTSAEVTFNMESIDCPVVAGGLVGNMVGGEVKTENGAKVTVSGTITAQSIYVTDTEKAVTVAGGVIGCAAGDASSTLTLDGFTVDAQVTSNTQNKGTAYAGGLIGQLLSEGATTISNCAFDGTLSVPNGKEKNVGNFYGAKASNTVTDGGGNTLNGSSADVNRDNVTGVSAVVHMLPPADETPVPEPEPTPSLAPAPVPDPNGGEPPKH